ncbi:hypothetical protein Slin14017_G123430 [Septoria linicola]|nr:hypothetical protein Slin14017_G123430 [Septoria linicola]
MVSTLRRPYLSGKHYAVKAFSTASIPRASILFQLGALSNSRETQHFNKISKLNRYDHSPNLKLIKSSEIDPYPVPIERLLQNAPPTRADSSTTGQSTFRRADTGPAWDAKALAVGRAVLADTQLQRSRMSRLVGRAKRREIRATQSLAEKVAALAHERRRMREEMRSAGYLIFLSVATATGFAMWTFWPADRAREGADIGRKIAEKARASIPLPSITPITPAKEIIAGAGAVPAVAAVTGEPTVAPAVVLREEAVCIPAFQWSWRSLFWKEY